MTCVEKLCYILFIWKIKPASATEIAEADAIVTQSHYPIIGYKRQTTWPGNQILATTAKTLGAKYGLPLLIQEELQLVQSDIPYAHITRDPNRTGISSATWNTFEVAILQKQFCDKMAWDKVIVVAHPDHMLRAIWVYQKLGIKALAAPMPQRLTSYACPRSILYSKIGFRIRELCARLLFWYWDYI